MATNGTQCFAPLQVLMHSFCLGRLDCKTVTEVTSGRRTMVNCTDPAQNNFNEGSILEHNESMARKANTLACNWNTTCVI